MNFEFLCRQYELGEFQTAAPLNPGTVAQVWRMDTAQGAFLVRTLTGPQQGELEWRIHQHLTAAGFDHMPAIILTAAGEPFLEVDGVWCQVQGFVAGTMPDPAKPGVVANLARLAKQLAGALADFPGGPVIHGDLGPWNMLQCGDGRLVVMDFGAARAGHPCFDYAALLGGVINHTPAEQRTTACRDFVRTLDCDRGELLAQLRLWAAEGICRWAEQSESMAARFHHALNWAEEHLYDL